MCRYANVQCNAEYQLQQSMSDPPRNTITRLSMPYQSSYLIKPFMKGKKKERRKKNLPHEVEVELARLAKALALHDTSNHAVVDSAEVHDGRELVEDQRSRDEVVVFHPTKL